MAGIYQINQQTSSATPPSAGNTFIGTSDNSELYTVDYLGNVTVYGTGGGGTIDTGSFATTGSNIFTGDQTITGSINSTALTPSGSQGIIQINDGDILSIFSALSGSGFESGSFMGVRYIDPDNVSFDVGVSNAFNILKSAGFTISSGSALIAVGGQISAGGSQTQMIFSPDFVNGSESYNIQVGSTAIGENRLRITKGDQFGEGIQLRASNLTEGFILENSFSDVSSSLFKIETSGSSTVLFDARNNGVILPIVSQSLDYADDTAAGAAGVPLGGVYRTGSTLKIRIS